MGVQATGQTVLLNHESGSSAEIHLFGATVFSWKVGGREKFFVSSKSAMDGSAAIRGGIPICFPVFGPPPSTPADYASLAQHGYVRKENWTLDKIIMDRSSGVSVRFLAPPPPDSFQHKYKLAYVVTLAAHELSTDVHVTNEDDKGFDFQCLLHNYLAVPDSKKISIEGIHQGVQYKDKTKDMKMFSWGGGPLTIKGETDSVFQKIPSQELKLDYGNGSGLIIHFRGFEDTTIWNPTEIRGRGIADMEDNGWDRYVCIEPGYVREFKSLKPGEEFLGQQVLKVFPKSD